MFALALASSALGADGIEYRGTDVFGQLPATDGLHTSEMDRYPLGRYTLDWFIDASNGNGILPSTPKWSAIPAVIAQTFAGWLWTLTKVMVSFVITLVTWAFGFSLIGSTPGAGTDALDPVSRAIVRIREGLVGDAWLAVGLLLGGLWATFNAFGRGRRNETIGALLGSVALIVVGFAFVASDQWVVRKVSDGASQMATAALASVSAGADAARRGDDDGTAARREVADGLFETLVIRPWAALEFGGLDHCTNAGGNPMPCNGTQARRIDHLPARLRADGRSLSTVNGQGDYVDRYLRHPPADGTDSPRGKEFEALGKGQVPSDNEVDNQPEGAAVAGLIDKHDRPAVDLQQAAGSDQRLIMAGLIFVIELGAALLVGSLALGVVLSQAFVLLLVAFAPVVLVVAAIPRFGHDLFLGWLKRLGWLLVAEVLLAVALAVLLIVAQALSDASSALDWQLALVLQGVFFWAVWLFRHRLLAMGSGVSHRELRQMERGWRNKGRGTVTGARKSVDRAAGLVTKGVRSAGGAAAGATRRRIGDRLEDSERRRNVEQQTARDALRRAAHQRLEAETAAKRQRVEQEQARRAEVAALQRNPARTPEDDARLAELRRQAPHRPFAWDRDRRDVEEIDARRRAGHPPYTQSEYATKEAEIERHPARELPATTRRNGNAAEHPAPSPGPPDRNGNDHPDTNGRFGANGDRPPTPRRAPGERRGHGRPPRQPGGDEE